MEGSRAFMDRARTGRYMNPAAQKRHPRVQADPSSRKVAVPRLQHSPRLGHLADWQMVARRPWPIAAATSPAFFVPNLILSQGGLR